MIIDGKRRLIRIRLAAAGDTGGLFEASASEAVGCSGGSDVSGNGSVLVDDFMGIVIPTEVCHFHFNLPTSFFANLNDDKAGNM